MSQTSWERRVLLVLGREDEIKQPKEKELTATTPDEMSQEAQETYQKLLGLGDAGLVSRSTILQEIYKVNAEKLAKLNATMRATADSYSLATATVKEFKTVSGATLEKLKELEDY